MGALLLAGILRGETPQSLPSALSKAPLTAPAVHRISTIENNRSCDIGNFPAATLLLPYFEVEITKPGERAANTLFAVVNTSKSPQVARVTIWTDYGYPTFWFNVFLTGYDVQSFSMYDMLALGKAPQTSSSAAPGARSESSNASLTVDGCGSLGGQLTPSLLADIQSMLTHGKSTAQEDGCRVGGEHVMALGYVTIDVVNGCSNISPLDPAYYSQVLLFDNVLTGDYDRINPDREVGNHAGGNPLVHIRAIPEGGKAGPLPAGSASLPYTFYDRFTPATARHIDRRQPLPSSFAARYIEGGTASFATDYAIWREGADRIAGGNGCNVTASAAMPYASIVRFDEMENPTVAVSPKATGGKPLVFPVTSAPSAAEAPFPPQAGYTLSGWIYLNLDNTAGSSISSASPFSTPRPSQNWVIVHMRADGRYAVDFNATTISNGCGVLDTEYK